MNPLIRSERSWPVQLARRAASGACAAALAFATLLALPPRAGATDWLVNQAQNVEKSTSPAGPWTAVSAGDVLRGCTWTRVPAVKWVEYCKTGTVITCPNYVKQFRAEPGYLIGHLRNPNSPAFIDIWENNSGSQTLSEYGTCTVEEEHCGLGVADETGLPVLADAYVLNNSAGLGQVTDFRMDYDAVDRLVTFCNFPYSHSNLLVTIYEGPDAGNQAVLPPGESITISATLPTTGGPCAYDVDCDPTGPLPSPPDCRLSEGEPCGADINGGCNSSPPAYTPACANSSYCGEAYANAGVRDTDWFELQLTPEDDANGDGLVQMEATVVSQFPCSVAFVDVSDCALPVLVGTFGYGDSNCGAPTPAVATLAIGGSYAVFVGASGRDAAGIFDGIPCGLDNNYVLTIDAADEDGPCEGDLNGDDEVSFADLLILLGEWGNCPPPPLCDCPADFNRSGDVGFGDLLILLGNWGQCPIDLLDAWTTPDDGLNISSYDFGGANPPIPADFFGPGSDPFIGQVTLIGQPLDWDSTGVTDTVVRRLAPFSGAPVPETVPIELVQLSLVSAAPITVTENGGQNPEQWIVNVSLSDTAAPPGNLNTNPIPPNGGLFDANINVNPIFTFTNLSDLSDLVGGLINPEDVRMEHVDLFEDTGLTLQLSFPPGNQMSYVNFLCPEYIDQNGLFVFPQAEPGFIPGISDKLGDGCSFIFKPGPMPHVTPGEAHYIAPPNSRPGGGVLDRCQYAFTGFVVNRGGCVACPPAPPFAKGRRCIPLPPPAGDCLPFLLRIVRCPGGGFCVQIYANPVCIPCP